VIEAEWVFVYATLGALGALVRYGVMVVLKPSEANLGLWLVNSLGSLLVGVAVGAYAVDWLPWATSSLVAAFCAGLTTFSTLTVTVANSITNGKTFSGIGLISSQMIVGVGFAVVGYISTISLFGA
jgi:fluoride ion exporter CrcB/FEX